ncbi:MAG: DNA polymerase III subunit gamma/tau [Oscillospiraceae bacterium]|nr:DNA polymerase III subunit gamma/tau [Oscillospiraceae bacterium]
MYQALYRKWRPKRFEDVVGQEHITETLRRQASSGRLSHAYLFVGTRGTGKTTCAKILAKAVNCEHPVNGDPCNECASCRGIDSGAILDIEELDAASNNGVENIRALRDEAVFTPATVRRRVYIIDEVHMLSISAFNALLKILEEPPEHLIFILATTELRKVPATILSRCQRFSFRRISPEDICARLSYIAAQEGIDLTPDAADMLSRLADGSLRDALSLLDQCACGDTVDEKRVIGAIGLAGSEATARLLEKIAAHDVSSALEILDSLYFEGKDALSVLRELAALMRDVLLKITAPKSADKLASGRYSGDTVARFAKSLSPDFLINGIDGVQEASAASAESVDKRTAAELCIIKLCMHSVPPVSYPAPARTAEPPIEQIAAAEKAPEREKKAEEEAPPEAVKTPENDEKAEPETVETVAEAPRTQDGDIWREVLSAVESRIGPASYSFLSDSAQAQGCLSGNTLEIRAGSEFAAGMLDTPEVTGAVREEAGRLLGRPVVVKVVVGAIERELKSDKLDELMKFGNVKMI